MYENPYIISFSYFTISRIVPKEYVRIYIDVKLFFHLLSGSESEVSISHLLSACEPQNFSKLKHKRLKLLVWFGDKK